MAFHQWGPPGDEHDRYVNSLFDYESFIDEGVSNEEPMSHVIYTNKDFDAPSCIREYPHSEDPGAVCLAMCRNCGMAEIELNWFPECPGTRDEAIKLLSERAEQATHAAG